jgi:uncharacterized membrane protein YcaP (DUF421 family)
MHVIASQTTSDLFTIGIPIAEKVLRTIGVYVGLVLLLRLAGKRDLAQLNSFDLVVLLLLSNVVQNAVIGNDNSLSGGLLGAAVLISLNAVVVRLIARSAPLATVLEGTETCIVRDGVMLSDVIARLGLRDAEVRSALLRQGASTVEEVAQAVLTPGGTIEVTLEPADQSATKGDLEALAASVTLLDAKIDRLLAAQA